MDDEEMEMWDDDEVRRHPQRRRGDIGAEMRRTGCCGGLRYMLCDPWARHR